MKSGMPITFITLHLLLTLLCGWMAWRMTSFRGGRLIKLGFGAVGLALLGIGTLADRYPGFAAMVIRLQWPDAIFLSNLFLEAVAVMLALIWRPALRPVLDRGRAGRALLITPVALGAALWSYAWYFAPLPAGLNRRAPSNGLFIQSSRDSCSAAAAATLLTGYGIRTNEYEMARLSLTRRNYGTPTLGLFRGLYLRGQEKGLRVDFLQLSEENPVTAVASLARLHVPSIISAGMPAAAPPNIARRLLQRGWRPGVRHAVVIVGVDKGLRSVRVSDPSYGREEWAAEDLWWLWDGRALVMRPESDAIGYIFPGFPPPPGLHRPVDALSPAAGQRSSLRQSGEVIGFQPHAERRRDGGRNG